MKKSIIGLFLSTSFCFIAISNAQNTFPSTGNVGVGTTTPTAKLEVTSGTAGASGVKLTNVTSTTATVTGNSRALSVDASGNIILTPVVNTAPATLYSANGTLAAARTVTMSGKNLTFNPSTANSQFFINGTTGNVGLGTVTPSTRLDVNGDIKGSTGTFTNSLPDGSIFTTGANSRNVKCRVLGAGKKFENPDGYNEYLFTVFDFPQSNENPKAQSWIGLQDRNWMSRWDFNAETGGGSNLYYYNKTQTAFYTLSEDGNNNVTLKLPNLNSYVMIGTSSYQDASGDYKLSVKGKVRADAVKVYTAWADYVFKPDYNLLPLNEVQNFITKNGHLPNVPSEKEVLANGIDLGSMNAKLLEKIEELTLYVIQQQKEIENVKKENSDIKLLMTQLLELQKRIEQFENK